MPGTYYQSSGRSPVLGILLALALSAAAAIVLAFVHAYVIAYIPIAGYITFIFSIGLGVGMGFAAAKTLHLGKVRGTGASWMVFLATALVGFWVSWAVWTYIALDRADVDVTLVPFLTHPAETWEVIKFINANGAWSIKGWVPTGGILWAFWAVEAVLIFASTLVMGLGHIGSAVFCERCNAWCEDTVGVAVLGGDASLGTLELQHAALKQRAEQSDWAYFKGQSEPDINAFYYRADVQACQQCKNTNTLTVQQVTVTYDKEGARSESLDVIVDRLLITAQDVKEIGQLRAGPGDVEVAVTP